MFLSHRLVVLGALVTTITLMANACSGSEGASPSAVTQARVPNGQPMVSADLSTLSAKALRIGVVSRSTLDPAAMLPSNQGEMLTADLLFDSLTSTDPNTGAARPSIAFAWTVNAAQTVWRFALGDTRFSDGRPITSADVKASLERVASQTLDSCKRSAVPTTAADGAATRRECQSLASQRLEVIDGYREFSAGVIPDIRGLQAVEDKIIQIETREPFSPLPELLASPVFGIVPKDAGSPAEFDQKVVTSGPYNIIERGDAIVRLAKSSSNPSPTAVEDVEIVHFLSIDSSYEAFRDGKLDWSLVPQERVADAVAQYSDVAVKSFNAEQFFGLNLADPKLSNEKFRQAMLKAIDRNALIDKVLPGRTRLNGSVPIGVPGALEDACGAACVADPGAAKSLLAEAYPDGNIPEVEISVYDDGYQKALAEGIRDMWSAVGIKATVVAKPVEEFQGFLASGKQQVFGLGWVGLYPDPDAYLAPLFLSGSLDNVTNFTSDDLDGGLKEARGISDREARIAKYADMQRTVMEALPIIPLVSATTNAVVSRRVHGYAGRIDGTFDIDKLELDL